MRPVFTPEQEDLRAAVREFCDREVTPEKLLAWEETPDGADTGIRDAIAHLGWLGLGAPVAAGGSGAPLTDVASLVSECARGLLPRSLLGALRGAMALADVAPGSPTLAQIAGGAKRLTVAVDEENARSAEAFATKVESVGDGAVVSGEKAYVPDAASSELYLVAAREGEGTSLVLVDAMVPEVRKTPLRTFGGDRQAHLRFRGAPVLERLSPPGGGAPALARLVRRQQALALAEMVGGMEAVLEASVAYVKEREQFGQKIALFQAVRHQIADMGIRFTAARHLVWQAITRIDSDADRGHELAGALAYAGRAFKELCFTGHHLHGGAGFVVEHRLRFHSERAQSLAIRYAPEAPALAEIASSLLD